MLHTLDNGILRVQISDKGAELQSMQTADGHEYLWQEMPAIGRIVRSICFLRWDACTMPAAPMKEIPMICAFTALHSTKCSR